MRTKVTAVAAIAAMAVTLTAVAAAGPVAAKQRVAIQEKANGSFVLTPLTPGAIKRDTGTASFCCWTERHIMRDGQAIDINDPPMDVHREAGHDRGPKPNRVRRPPGRMGGLHRHLESHPRHGRLRGTLRRGTRCGRPAGQGQHEGAVRGLPQPEIAKPGDRARPCAPVPREERPRLLLSRSRRGADRLSAWRFPYSEREDRRRCRRVSRPRPDEHVQGVGIPSYPPRPGPDPMNAFRGVGTPSTPFLYACARVRARESGGHARAGNADE